MLLIYICNIFIYEDLLDRKYYLANDNEASYQTWLRDAVMADFLLTFQGVMMGNPIIDRIDMENMSSVYYHWGLIDSQGLLAAKPLQDQYSQAIKENHSKNAYDVRNYHKKYSKSTTLPYF